MYTTPNRVRQMLTRRRFASAVAAGLSTAAPLQADNNVPNLHAVLLPGLDFVQRNSPTSQKYLMETMCGGVALFDYNNDGLLDIFLVNGGRLDDPVKLPARF